MTATAANPVRIDPVAVGTPAGINTLVVDTNANRRASTERVLGRLGYCVVDHGVCLAEIDTAALNSEIGVIVIGVTSATSELMDEVRAFRARLNVPILVLSEDADTHRINSAVNIEFLVTGSHDFQTERQVSGYDPKQPPTVTPGATGLGPGSETDMPVKERVA